MTIDLGLRYRSRTHFDARTRSYCVRVVCSRSGVLVHETAYKRSRELALAELVEWIMAVSGTPLGRG